ncbi:hypothetical protein YIM1640_19140 [Thermus oshimai]|uniref:hypothetical protein n=1 Tax=Thermus oshimai TaxID=56957 RepID=UPI000376ED53|nr:hypothetical protein [Thermus oshimai]
MPRGENLERVRPPKERRAALLGVELLAPGEGRMAVSVRGPKGALEVFKALPAKERGRVVVAGLKALGLWEEGDGEEAGQR